MIKTILPLPAAALSFALLFSPFTTAATAAPDPNFMLDLGGQRFDPLVDPPAATVSRDAGAQLRLVQFSGPIQPDWLEALDHAGAEVLQYIHPYSYVVWADAQQVSRAAQSVPLRWNGAYIAGFALSQASRGLDAQPYPVMVMAARKADAGARQSGLHALGAKIERITRLDQHFDLLHLEIAGDRLAELAALPGMFAVQRIQPITAEEAKRGEKSQLSVVGAHGPAPSYTLVPGYFDWLAESGYDGDGVVVGIVDGGVRLSHQELVGRMLPCENSGMTGVPTSCNVLPDDHGTHVAAAVAGIGAGALDGNGFRRGQGVAPGAKLVAQDYDPFLGGGPGGMVADGMLTIYRESALSGAVLTNNSWGPTGSPQGYDIPTRQMDMVTRDALEDVPGQQPVLPVWSIMNGNGDRNSGTCRPASLGSPDEAKNLFAVGSTKMQSGASQTAAMFDISSNSAHGDACDGRRVPHIVAPGCSTDSATDTNDTAYAHMCGTSMASPVVSGAVALFIEKYRDLHDGATPSPALVKAAFTAVARDLHGQRNADNGVMGHRPDRFQGYGRLDLDAVINPSESVLYFDQEHVFRASGQHWEPQLVAADPTRPVRIMLAWTDAPGAGLGGTTPAWVNDLDLLVMADDVVYRGNAIGDDGWSAADGQADPRNNLEGVFLGPHQHTGTLTLRVDATNVAANALDPWQVGRPRPAQDFALICYNCRMIDLFGDGFE